MTGSSFLSFLVLTWANPPNPAPPPEPPPAEAPAPIAPPPADAASCNCEVLQPPPTYIDPDPSKNIPPGYHLEGRRRNGLLISGGIILGISYLVPIVFTVGKSKGQSSWYLGPDELPFDPNALFMPVIGPWLALSDMQSYCGDQPRGADPSTCTKGAQRDAAIWKAVLIVDGLVQLSGATLLILGRAWPRQELVINNDVRARVVPAPIGSSGHGLAIVGTFGGP